MTTATEFVSSEEAAAVAAKRVARRALWHTRINRAAGYLEVVGLGWLMPLMRVVAGDNIREQGKELWRQLGVPLIAILIFLAAWA
jgi:nitrate/nitrite transport system permease protein